MMIKTENYCVGCPQGCIHCGRDRDVRVYACDDCETTLWDDEIYVINDKMLCRDCAIEYVNDNIDELVLDEYKQNAEVVE